jgi:hypothetical protein
MIAINLDNNNFLNIRKYKPEFLKHAYFGSDGRSPFVTQFENPSGYHILKSHSLTAAFLKKYELESFIINLIEGYTIILPDFYEFNEKDKTELRAFRYLNFYDLPTFYHSFNLRDIKNEQPTKVLVKIAHGSLDFKTYEKSLLQITINNTLKNFPRSFIYQTKTHFYFTGSLSESIKNMWIKRFERLNIKINLIELDKNISVLIIL